MAKKSQRRFNLRKVRIAASIGVGALAAGDVTSGAMTATSANKYRVTSVKASYSLTDRGAAIDDGQQFGIAHSDYSAAEIEECLEATASVDIGDKIAQERSNRLVREIGTITAVGSSAGGGGGNFNDGRPVKTKLNWVIGIGDTLVLYIRNSSGVVYTTGALMNAKGEMWVSDRG